MSTLIKNHSELFANPNMVAKPSLNGQSMLRWSQVVIYLKAARARANQRRQLGQLNAKQLDDMGISPAEALAESRKYFWQQ